MRPCTQNLSGDSAFGPFAPSVTTIAPRLLASDDTACCLVGAAVAGPPTVE